ncbi:hypothetical protein AGMMS50267_17820 [Spirochaetia bacterium]|nr:hypothetical protein AGMMS50267_17820 [Spirochaetia bacterium]
MKKKFTGLLMFIGLCAAVSAQNTAEADPEPTELFTVEGKVTVDGEEMYYTVERQGTGRARAQVLVDLKQAEYKELDYWAPYPIDVKEIYVKIMIASLKDACDIKPNEVYTFRLSDDSTRSYGWFRYEGIFYLDEAGKTYQYWFFAPGR